MTVDFNKLIEISIRLSNVLYVSDYSKDNPNYTNFCKDVEKNLTKPFSNTKPTKVKSSTEVEVLQCIKDCKKTIECIKLQNLPETISVHFNNLKKTFEELESNIEL